MSLISFKNDIVPLRKAEKNILSWCSIGNVCYSYLIKGDKRVTCSFITWVSSVSERYWNLQNTANTLWLLK